MRSVKCTLDENEFKNITDEAKRLGVPRSELIRTRIQARSLSAMADYGRQAVKQITTSEYLDIVSSVRRRMGNSISPSQVEQCVAITLKCMHG